MGAPAPSRPPRTSFTGEDPRSLPPSSESPLHIRAKKERARGLEEASQAMPASSASLEPGSGKKRDCTSALCSGLSLPDMVPALLLGYRLLSETLLPGLPYEGRGGERCWLSSEELAGPSRELCGTGGGDGWWVFAGETPQVSRPKAKY